MQCKHCPRKITEGLECKNCWEIRHRLNGISVHTLLSILKDEISKYTLFCLAEEIKEIK